MFVAGELRFASAELFCGVDVTELDIVELLGVLFGCLLGLLALSDVTILVGCLLLLLALSDVTILVGCLLLLLALSDVATLLSALTFEVAGSFDGTRAVDIIVFVGDEATTDVTSRGWLLAVNTDTADDTCTLV